MNVRAYFAGGFAFAVMVGGFVACVGDDPTATEDVVDSGTDATNASDSPVADSATDGGASDSSMACAIDASGAFKAFSAFNDSLGTANGVATVSTGHILVGGYAGTAAFGADSGTPITSTPSGDDDAFVVSKNTDGTIAWSDSFGGTDVDMFYSVATDEADNVYVAGVFSSTTFTVGSTSFTNGSGAPLQVVAKLSSAGVVDWAESFSPSAAPPVPFGQNGCVIGYSSGRVSLACTMGLSQNITLADGGADVLTNTNLLGASVFGLDPTSGGVLWSHALETNDPADGGTQTTITSLEVSPTSTVIAGTFTGSTLMASGTTSVSLARVGALTNGFVIELGPNGGPLWAKRFGASSGGGVGAVYVDGSSAANGVLVGGSITGSTDFGGGPVTPVGSSDGYVMLLANKAGAPAWVKSFAGTNADQIERVHFDPCGNPEFMLGTASTLTIDGVAFPAPQGGAGAQIIGKLMTTSTSATVLWANGVAPGGTSDTTAFLGHDFAINARSISLMVGEFKGNADFGDGILTGSKSPGYSPYEVVYAP